METHTDHGDHRYLRLPEATARRTTRLTPAEWIETGVGAGILAGLVMTLPLPIARDGAPFRATVSSPALFVGPDWVRVVAFTAFGLAVGAFYALLRPLASTFDGNGDG